MAPRKRRKRPIRIPVNQGSLAYIAAIFIKPLLRQRPAEVSVSDWLNLMFCTHQRVIREYVVEKPFSIPGKYRVLPTRNALSKKEGFRNLRPGSSIWLRVDHTVKNRVEVETHNARGGKTQLFELTVKQWKSITPFLKQAPRRRRKNRLRRSGRTTSSHLIQRRHVPKVV